MRYKSFNKLLIIFLITLILGCQLNDSTSTQNNTRMTMAKATLKTAQKVNKTPNKQSFDFGPNVDTAQIPKETKDALQEILDQLGDAPKNKVYLNGSLVRYLDDGSLQMIAFVRNGFDYPIWDIQGKVDVLVNGKVIASDQFAFPKDKFGTLNPKFSRVVTLSFDSDKVKDKKADLKSYDLKWDLEYAH